MLQVVPTKEFSGAGRNRAKAREIRSVVGAAGRDRRGSGLFLAGDERIDDAREDGADDRRDPEQPELREGPAADEERRAGAAGRVDREVGDRDADQVDQRQAEADGDRREARRARACRWRRG